MKKLFALGMIGALTCASVSAQTIKQIPMDEEKYESFYLQHISADGKYISGYATKTGQPVIVDWQNDNVKVFEKVMGAETPWVANNGAAVGYTREGSFKASFATGECEVSNTTDENGIHGVYAAMSEDGTVIVGAYIDTLWQETACYWENGVRKDLPMPTAEEMGASVDGARAKGISKDGNVIMGYISVSYTTMWWGAPFKNVFEPMVIWVRQTDGTYTCDPVCKDWIRLQADNEAQKNNPYKQFMPVAISPNGQFVAVNIRDYYGDDDLWPTLKMGRYEVATKKLEVFEVEDDDCQATAIANDGTMVGRTDGQDRIGIIVRPEDKLPKALYTVFGNSEFYYFDTFGEHEVTAISEDGRYIGGIGPVMKGESIYPSGREAYVLDTKGDASAISNVNTDQQGKAEYYTIDGRKSHAPAKGINIVRTATGKTRKVLVK